MADKESIRIVMTLLDGLSDEEVRADCFEALRKWRRKPIPKPPHPYGPGFPAPTPPPDPLGAYVREIFSMHGDLGVELVKILAARKVYANPDTHTLKEVFIDGDAMQREWARGIFEFECWLVRSGLAVELSREHGYPVSFRLTRRGVRLLDEGDDHPLLPGFLDRIEARCKNLPAGVIALLVDARACLDRALLRPAVILTGVAFELAIEEVVGVLANKNLVSTGTPGQLPAKRIERIKELINDTDKVKVVLPTTDARTAALAAYDFADTLRLRRNEAAHTRPAYDFDHGGETEEFLVSAGRHLPALWSLALEP